MSREKTPEISRRDFLKTATLAGLGLTIGSGCEREINPKNLTMTLGKYGTYKTVYDENYEMYVLGLWETNRITEGKEDPDTLKTKGGRIIFTMPLDGAINNSAGTIKINGEEWTLGNPATSEFADTKISQGDSVEIEYGPMNDSAGFQIMFEN